MQQSISKLGPVQGGVIGVTQPRRVAAVSVARRVAQEMGVALGAEARPTQASHAHRNSFSKQ